MKPVSVVTGTMVPLPQADIDTDQIIPKQFLTRTERTGYGDFLFYDWARTQDGTPSSDFFVNDPDRAGARVLVAGRNFGCGSSREHAPQAIRRRGFRAVVGESYSEIFFGNAVALGMPCVKAAADDVAALMDVVERDPTAVLTLDLDAMRVITGSMAMTVSLPPGVREAFLEGTWDATGLLLDRYQEVEAVMARLPYLSWNREA